MDYIREGYDLADHLERLAGVLVDVGLAGFDLPDHLALACGAEAVSLP